VFIDEQMYRQEGRVGMVGRDGREGRVRGGIYF